MADVCRSCGAAIIWLRTLNGGRMPVDAEPVADGNIVRRGNACRVLPKDEALGAKAVEGEPRFMSHFVTCPVADKWKGTRR
jgi:hypothetical protein